MLRHALPLLLAACLLVGCAPKPTASAPPPIVTTETAAPAPAPATEGQVALPKLDLADVLAINVWMPEPNRTVRLLHSEHGPLIEAVVRAVNGAGPGRLRTDTPNVRLSATIVLHTGEALILSLLNGAGAVAGSWKEQNFYVADSAIAEALRALESQVAAMPKEQPVTRLWSIDPTGQKEQETLLDYPESLRLRGASPDARYVLFTKDLGEYKGDYRAIPYLWDRTTDKLTEGKQTLVRFAQWSGHGFFINVTSHLDLTLKETQLESLAAALGGGTADMALPPISFTPDGKRFAALVNAGWPSGKVDLLTGNVDGTGIVRVPQIGTGEITQMGTLASVSLSPDGKHIALYDKEGVRISPVADPTVKTTVPASGRGLYASWSPDSAHIFLFVDGMFDLAGKPVPGTAHGDGMVWRPDGQGWAIYDSNIVRIFTQSGEQSQMALPDWSSPVAFLPDGRLLVWHTARP